MASISEGKTYPWFFFSVVGIFTRAAALHAIWNWWLAVPTGLTLGFYEWFAIMAMLNLLIGYRYGRMIYMKQEPLGFFGSEIMYAFFTPLVAMAFFGFLHMVAH